MYTRPEVVVLDPSSGEIDYSWVPYENYDGFIVASATDYDLRDEHPWAVYKIENDIYHGGTLFNAELRSAEAIMDDGSSVRHEIRHYDLRFSSDRISERLTVKDAEGRVEAVTEEFLISPALWEFDYFVRHQEFDTTSGRLDYELTRHLDNSTVATDWDVATNQRDYVFTTYANGRMMSEDFNPASNLLDYRRVVEPDSYALDEDYDSAGRLDYVVERWSDGRMRVTDYDLADEHAWSSYSIAYNAAGQIEGLAVL